MNPLGYSDFGFSTANEAEPSEDANGSANGGGAEAKMEVSQLSLSSHMNFSKYSDNRILWEMIAPLAEGSGI